MRVRHGVLFSVVLLFYSLKAHSTAFEISQRPPKDLLFLNVYLSSHEFTSRSHGKRFNISKTSWLDNQSVDICIQLNTRTHEQDNQLVDICIQLNTRAHEQWLWLWSGTSYAISSTMDGIILSRVSVFRYKQKRKRLRYGKAPVAYYSNSLATQRLLLSGDISENPGPLQRATEKTDGNNKNKTANKKITIKCDTCAKTIRKNQTSISCSNCIGYSHRKCVDLKSSSRDWLCSNCLGSVLPFYKCSDADFFDFFDNTLDLSQDMDLSTISLESHPLCNKPSHLKILHLNTQSMVSTFNEFLLTVNSYPLDIVALSETWLRDQPHLLQYVSIPGFVTEFRNRTGIRGGGVGAYIKDNIKYKRRSDIERAHLDLEHLWLEVPGRNKQSRALVGVIYNSERILSPTDWLDRLENLLGYLTVSWDGILILTGDVNIDMLRPSDNLTKKYQCILDVFGLTQIVTRPTRVTKRSKTLIDHIITNHPQKVSDTGIIPCSIISDHDAVYACVNVRLPRFQPRYKYIRDVKSFDEELFKEDFLTLPLSMVSYSDDPDEQLETLNTLISECLERHAPLRRVRVTRPPAPWMKDPLISELQTKRNHARYTAHQTSSEAAWNLFRDVRNKLKSAIRTARKSFIEKALYSNKSRDVWKVIHRVLKPSPRPLRFDPDNLNDYFASAAQRTLESCATPEEDLTSYFDSLLDDDYTPGLNFHLSPVTTESVSKIIKTLRSDCSTGADHIPTRFVKLVAEHLADPLTTIINNCIANAYFPKLWKVARVSPVPKTDNPIANDQLRPISILPVLSKVFEKLVANQIADFAESASLLHERISSFRKGHSTTTALLGIRDDIRHAMKQKEVTLMVLADFSKAFDTICFGTTITKLYKLGFTKPFLKWLLSYLSGRTQFVQIDDKQSSCKSSRFGIPQGSILGPMIFNLYVADLREITPPSIECAQYADDTSMYSHFNIRELDLRTKDMNSTLTGLSDWSQECNLALNPTKTKCMLFSTPQMSAYHSLGDHTLNLSVNGKPLERVRSTKLLGVYINDTLRWDDHVKYLASSCYGVLASLRKIKNFTNYQLRKHLVETLVMSRLDFNDIIFHPLTDALLRRLQKIQNSAASFVTGHYVNNIDSILKLGWLPMKERRNWHLLKTAHRALYHENWPSNLRLMKVNHTRELRSSSTLNLVISLVPNTFQDNVSALFNSLPPELKSCINFKSFSKQTFTILKERCRNSSF